VSPLGEIERARSLLAEARAIAQASGGNWDLALIDLYLGRLAHGRGDLECAHRHYLETLLLIRDPLDPTLVARSLEGLAGIAAAWGTPARGARLLGAAETLRAEAGQPMISEDFPTFDDARAAGRRLLAKEVYEEAVATGRTLAIDSAIAEALAIERPAAVVAPPDPLAGFGLTRREREVLTLLADGHSTNEIAAALFISPKTAGVHAANLLRKLGVPSRAAAVAFAHRHGLAAAVPRPARPEADYVRQNRVKNLMCSPAALTQAGRSLRCQDRPLWSGRLATRACPGACRRAGSCHRSPDDLSAGPSDGHRPPRPRRDDPSGAGDGAGRSGHRGHRSRLLRRDQRGATDG
jgi:DNA-binding CsgD family transcriptional regulator